MRRGMTTASRAYAVVRRAAHGIGHGQRAALDAVVGIAAASAIRVALTAAGLATLLASSASCFRSCAGWESISVAPIGG
jgi:threonine/homoserine/homoserine lactone efflux protein